MFRCSIRRPGGGWPRSPPLRQPLLLLNEPLTAQALLKNLATPPRAAGSAEPIAGRAQDRGLPRLVAGLHIGGQLHRCRELHL